MPMIEVAQWGMFGVALLGVFSAVTSHMVSQSSRISTAETEIRQLRQLVDRNARMVHDLAVSMSGLSEKLQAVIDMQVK